VDAAALFYCRDTHYRGALLIDVSLIGRPGQWPIS
jgi:hypothetical protein